MSFNTEHIQLVKSEVTLQSPPVFGKCGGTRLIPVYKVSNDMVNLDAAHADPYVKSNVPTQGWSFFAISSKSTVLMKAPPFLQVDEAIPTVVDVKLIHFMAWQAAQDITTLPFVFEYNLFSNIFQLVVHDAQNTKPRYKPSETPIKPAELTEADHGKLFKVAYEGDFKLRKAIYLHKHNNSGFLRLGDKGGTKLEITAANWLISTHKAVDSRVADMMWAKKFWTQVYETNRKFKALSVEDAKNNLPFFKMDELDSTSLKILSEQSHWFTIDENKESNSVIAHRVYTLPLLEMPLPALLEQNTEFRYLWDNIPHHAIGREVFTVAFNIRIDYRTKKIQAWLGIGCYDYQRALKLPELTSEQFLALIQEWFCHENAYGIGVQQVEGVYTGKNVPAKVLQCFKNAEFNFDFNF